MTVKGNAGMVSGIVLILALLFSPGAARAGTISVSWDPERITRGGVACLYVRSPVALLAAEGAVGDERFPLIPVGEEEYVALVGGEEEYVALVGVDLNRVEPTLPVDFAFFPAKGGPPYRIRADLKIREAGTEMEEQQLSLPTGMVDFSQKSLQQISRDNQTLGDALGARIRQRFWSQGFLIPVTGRITTRFGTRRVLNGKPRSPHNGVDIAGEKGTPVISSNRGKVLLADSFYLSGHTVVVDHGWGVSTIYAHLDSVIVSEGQEVERGQTIGTVGSTGRATGPHLHFGALIRGVKVDPLQLVEVTRDISVVRDIP